MKFKKNAANLIAIIFMQMTTQSLFGQYVENYKLSQHRGTVVLNWTITTGNVCDGVDIERSSDSIHFQVIGSIPGVCGSASEPRNYTFVDTAKNLVRKYYYRLNLRSLGLTEIISIYIPAPSDGWVTVFPNPAQGLVWLRLNDRSYRDSITLVLYSVHSGMSHQMRLFLSEEIRIPLLLEPGIYFYTIRLDLGISKSGLLAIY